MLQPRPTETHPTISVDTKYGALVDSLEIDAEGIAEYLRERGLGDDEISALTIRYSSDAPNSKLYNDKGRTFGEYISADKTINVYQPEVFFAYKAPLHEGSNRTLEISSNTRSQEQKDSTLIHELEHYIDDVTQALSGEMDAHGKLIKKEYIKLLIKNKGIAMLGMTGLVAAHLTWREDITTAVELTGIDSSWSGHAVSAAVVGVAALGLHISNKKLKKETNVISEVAYQSSPLEMNAREAQATYTRSFTDINILPERHDDVTTIIALSLARTGEVEGVVSQLGTEPR